MNRVMPLDPAALSAATVGLGPTEFGVLVRLALHWWVLDELPTKPAGLARIAGVAPRTVEVLMPFIEPYFHGDGVFSALKAEAAAQSARRAAAGRIGGMRSRRYAKAGHG